LAGFSAKSNVAFPKTEVLEKPHLSLKSAGMPLLQCFSWSFFVEKTPGLKIRTDEDFKPTLHFFLFELSYIKMTIKEFIYEDTYLRYMQTYHGRSRCEPELLSHLPPGSLRTMQRRA
jgi:hypothetical protein